MSKSPDGLPVFAISESDDRLGELVMGYADKYVDINNEAYEFVTYDGLPVDYDTYQGLDRVSVIRRKRDRQLFGYPWWDDIGNDGNNTLIQTNGDEYGLEGFCEVEDDYDTFVSYAVWTPVKESTVPAYEWL